MSTLSQLNIPFILFQQLGMDHDLTLVQQPRKLHLLKDYQTLYLLKQISSLSRPKKIQILI